MAWAVFKDKDGKTSGTSISKVVIVFCVMLVWTVKSMQGSGLAAMPEEIVWLVGISLGIGVANKAVDALKGIQK